MLEEVAPAGASSVSVWSMLAAVVLASMWHPFRRGPRSAASSAGLRLLITFALLVTLFFVPHMFDRGNLE